ncbi:MAG: hypothetical protein V1909_04290 [Candidatus Micrarchaeota archaeon]
MAKSPSSIYGKVNCTTVIKFSKKEEHAMFPEQNKTFLFRAANDKPSGKFSWW